MSSAWDMVVYQYQKSSLEKCQVLDTSAVTWVISTVKPVLSGHSKIDNTQVLRQMVG